MIFFAKNIKRSMILHWKSNMLILADLVLCALMIFIMLQNYFFMKYDYNFYYGDEKLADRYRLNVVSGESDNPFEQSSPMYKAALQVKQDLWSSPLWKTNYIVLSTIPMEWLDPDLPQIFNIQNDPTIQRAPEETGISGYVFSDAVIQMQNIKLQEGRGFVSDDYQNTSSEMPVIMGYEFKQYFSLGEIIKQGDLSYCVIGFFEENSFCFPGSEEICNLDRSIVLPRVLYSDQFGEDVQLKFSLTCDLYPLDPQTDVQNEINRITSQYGFYGMTGEPINGSAYRNTELISGKNIALIFSLTVLSAILCLVALSNILSKRTLRDQATHCTYLLSGIPLWKINFSIIIELALWTAISVSPPIALSYFEYGQLFVSPWYILGFLSVIVAISVIPSFLIAGKGNIDLFIRNQSE